MPARQQINSQIISRYRLPDNKRRLSEGGLRLVQSDEVLEKPVPLISVVTIVLNGENYIEKTIESVIAQLDGRAEYVVIDGGSTDSTVDIIKKYERYLEYWVSEPDQGISDAFNKGIALCRGEVVGLLNAGDWYEAEAFNCVEKFFQENNDSGVLCGALQYWSGSEKAYIAESRPEMLGREMSITHSTCFVRREVYLQSGGFDCAYKYAMDYELLLRFYVQNVVFQTTQQILAHMLHEGISEQNWKKSLSETCRARQKYLPDSVFAGRVYLGYLIARKNVRFVLQALGMHGIIRFYRERVASVKKRLSD